MDNWMSRYQCQVCGHIYDPAEGEPTQGIALQMGNVG